MLHILVHTGTLDNNYAIVYSLSLFWMSSSGLYYIVQLISSLSFACLQSTTTTLHCTADYSNLCDLHSSGLGEILLANILLHNIIFFAKYLWTGKVWLLAKSILVTWWVTEFIELDCMERSNEVEYWSVKLSFSSKNTSALSLSLLIVCWELWKQFFRWP